MVKNASQCMDALLFVKITFENFEDSCSVECYVLDCGLWGSNPEPFSLESSVRLRLIMTVSSDSVLVLNHKSCGDFKGTEDRKDSCYICRAVL